MEELKAFDSAAQRPTRPSEERLRQIFEQAEPCEIESAGFMLNGNENTVELFITFKDADGIDKVHAIRFAVEPTHLWASFTTDYRLKMIQVYSEFTSRMAAEAIDDYVKRIRCGTLKGFEINGDERLFRVLDCCAPSQAIAFHYGVERDDATALLARCIDTFISSSDAQSLAVNYNRKVQP